MGDGTRGRMVNASDRRQAVEVISEAVDASAALYKACAERGISKRTYNRWKNTDSNYINNAQCARDRSRKQDDTGGKERDIGRVQLKRVFIQNTE